MAMLPNGQPVFSAEEELSSLLYEHSQLEHETVESHARHGNQALEDSIGHERDQPESDLDIPPEPSPKRRASVARRAGLNIGKPMRPLQSLELNVTRSSPRRVGRERTEARHSADLGIGTLDDHVDIENNREDQSTGKVRSFLARISVEANL
jgi:hypothetical protein